MDEGDVNSTRIRRLLSDGLPELAARMLGRPYAVRGTVVRGDERGRTLGFPTANLDPESEVLPAPGVYAGTLRLLDAGDPPAETRLRRRHERRAAADLRARAPRCSPRRTRSTGAAISTGAASSSRSRSGCARSASSRASTRCARRSPPTRTRRAAGSPSREQQAGEPARSEAKPSGSDGARSARVARPRGRAARALVRAARRRPATRWRAQFRARALGRAARRLGARLSGGRLAARAALAPSHRRDPADAARSAVPRVAVGFMANNLFPLRIGELVRVGYLARETRTPGRRGARHGRARARDRRPLRARDGARGARVARAARRTCFGAGSSGSRRSRSCRSRCSAGCARRPSALAFAGAGCLRPAPARVSEWVLRQLRGFAAGLGALRGGAHLAWIAVHSVGDLAGRLDAADPRRDLGGSASTSAARSRTLAAGWMTLAALGVAVALPSAPGFFGLYHSACRLALEQFGATAESALAVGTLAHAVFWVTLTGLGRSCCAGAMRSCASLFRLPVDPGRRSPRPSVGTSGASPSRRTGSERTSREEAFARRSERRCDRR